MDATAITAIRTAAVSGVATQWLAREDAHDLAIHDGSIQTLALRTAPNWRLNYFNPTMVRFKRGTQVPPHSGGLMFQSHDGLIQTVRTYRT
ncbi:hypothetical protein L0337_00175 [candidate division KSB1 bacterium]|nr:hypothetical protein [candidate division KSB1 bacterium]